MRWFGHSVVLAAFVLAMGCGGSDEQRKPDTGAGAGEAVPAALNCVDFCARLGACVVILCNEDTKSTRYSGFADLLAAQCQSTCTEATLMSGVSQQGWSCLFQSSCRQVFDYDTCTMGGSYYCM